MIDQNDVETRKFQMYAEKALTEARRIELCQKYLQSKGIKTVETSEAEALLARIAPPQIEKHYVGLPDLRRMESRYVIDDQNIHPTSSTNTAYIHARETIVKSITHELVRNDMITFDQFYDYYRAQTIIVGSLMVYKEKK